MADWSTFESRWEISAALVAQAGLRIGRGGESAEPTATDLPILRDAENRPYVPGSSLRGVLRSQIERIVRGLEPNAGHGRGACFPTEENGCCLTKARIDSLRQTAKGNDAEFSRSVIEESCRICRVFGSSWLASRVRVSDLCVNGPYRVEQRDGVAIDREKETVQHKYDFESVTAQARFDLTIMAENLDVTERGLLWLGLRELERGHIYVGGFKGRGLGQVVLENLAIKGVEPAGLWDYLIKGQLTDYTPAQADTWLEKLVDELRRPA